MSTFHISFAFMIRERSRCAVQFGLVTMLLMTHLIAGPPSEIVQDDITRQIDFIYAIRRLEQEWKAGAIERVEVMHVSKNVVFRTNVSSSMLESLYNFKLIIRDVRTSDITNDLLGVIMKLDAKASGKVADLRWGCVFYSRRDDRVLSIYFDLTGRKGIVNGACVEFDSDALLKWAESTCGAVFR